MILLQYWMKPIQKLFAIDLQFQIFHYPEIFSSINKSFSQILLIFAKLSASQMNIHAYLFLCLFFTKEQTKIHLHK